MMPSCSHTGTPSGFDGFLHFTSSTTLGSAALMRLRSRASVSPRQSPSAAILSSIRREGEATPFVFFAPLFALFMVVSLSFWGDGHAQYCTTAPRSGNEARQSLSRLHRGGRHGEVAPAQRLYLHRSSPGRESGRQLQDVVP